MKGASQAERANVFNRWKSRRGIVALVCLLVVSIALALIMSLSFERITRLYITKKKIARDQALCIAEAGADYGVSKLKTDSGYSGTETPISFGNGSFSVAVAESGGRKVITSIGRLPDNTTAVVKVEVEGSSGLTIPNGAIFANSDVTMSGQGNTISNPVSEHQASVRSNRNITISGQAYIDGVIAAHGTITASGQSSSYGGRQTGAPLIAVPTLQDNMAWKSRLQSIALNGTTRSGNVSSSQTWDSPVYVNGNLNVSGKTTLRINGGGVVFVNGNISLSGQSQIINSGILAASGTINVSGQTKYTVVGDINNIAIISFEQSSSAIQMTGQGITDAMGLIVAANGGIRVSGQGFINGALLAMGQGSLGTIAMSGQASVVYPANLLRDTEILPGNFAVRSWFEE